MGLLKSWTETVQEVREQTGVRKVDFVDGITPDLQEAKPEFEVKYASSKKGPIKVSKFMSLEDAKKFLAQVKKEGMNGIISKGGKPVKEEKVECPKCKGEGCEHCDDKGYHTKEETELESMTEEIHQLEERRQSYSNFIPFPEKILTDFAKRAIKAGLTFDQYMKYVKGTFKDGADSNNAIIFGRDVYKKKKGAVDPDAWNLKREETMKEAPDYDLYHKTFSSAMQHAYAHAKKKGFTVDPEEIDNKVATGPKKPSAGKTNRYILGTDKKKKVHIQVANLDNKKYELNMYIEETEKENMDINETIKQVMEGKVKKEDSDKSEPGTQGDDKEYQSKRDKILKKYGVESCAQCKTEEEKKACFNELDKAHVGDHEEQVQKESENEKKDTTYGVKKKAKEPQEEGYGSGKGMVSTVYKKKKVNADTLLDKVKNIMKEKKSKKY